MSLPKYSKNFLQRLAPSEQGVWAGGILFKRNFSTRLRVTSLLLDCQGLAYHRAHTEQTKCLRFRLSQNCSLCIQDTKRPFSSGSGEDDKEQKDMERLEQDLKAIAKKESNQFWAHWKRELRSPPNVITTTRILFAPVLSYFIVSGQHQLALYGCIVAAASDWLDGYLARHHNMSTVLGAFLDPMADKIIINVLSISLWYTEILPTPLVGLWFAKDFLLIFGCAAYVRTQSKDSSMAYDPVTTPLKVLPTKTSKINTALQFLTLGVGIVYPLSSIPPEVLTGLW